MAKKQNDFYGTTLKINNVIKFTDTDYYYVSGGLGFNSDGSIKKVIRSKKIERAMRFCDVNTAKLFADKFLNIECEIFHLMWTPDEGNGEELITLFAS